MLVKTSVHYSLFWPTIVLINQSTDFHLISSSLSHVFLIRYPSFCLVSQPPTFTTSILSAMSKPPTLSSYLLQPSLAQPTTSSSAARNFLAYVRAGCGEYSGLHLLVTDLLQERKDLLWVPVFELMSDRCDVRCTQAKGMEEDSVAGFSGPKWSPGIAALCSRDLKAWPSIYRLYRVTVSFVCYSAAWRFCFELPDNEHYEALVIANFLSFFGFCQKDRTVYPSPRFLVCQALDGMLKEYVVRNWFSKYQSPRKKLEVASFFSIDERVLAEGCNSGIQRHVPF